MKKINLIIVAMVAFMVGVAFAGEKNLTSDKSAENYGWTFDNGQEFPGATGKLSIDAAEKNALKLEGNFTNGGNYVETKIKLDNVEVNTISFLLKYPNASHLTMRIIDSGDQCHQISFKIKNTPDWQKVNFDLGSYLAEKGNSPAAEIVKKYENWGGANDGKWHGPAKLICILVGKTEENKTPTLWLNEFKLITK
ncbi:MAG TPA: hypothetical protein DET40_22475 [Lentisphaeria bacterium]|nr:MAG: hypothetical protein A2X45_17205 [Lentisphaerae bacterium GWF2_50_93]HCE46321.1 hypothetical protein [Lentisphaeria bacterium]